MRPREAMRKFGPPSIYLYLLAVLIAVLGLTGCGGPPQTGEAPTVTFVPPTDTPLPPPTFTLPPPTATLAPTETPSPTLPPSATATPSITPTVGPNAQVAAGPLRLRAAPEDDAGVLASLEPNTALAVVGRTADNAWLEVITAEGQQGWVMAQYVSLAVDLAAVPVTFGVLSPAELGPALAPLAGPGQVAAGGGGLRLRAQPDESSAILTNLPELTPLVIIGRTADNLWLRVITPENITGWLWAAYVDLAIDINSVPVVDPAGAALGPLPTAIVYLSPTPGPSATPRPTFGPVVGAPARPTPAQVAALVPNAQVAAGRGALRLRAAPSESGSVLTMLPELAPLTVTGRTADGQWLYVTVAGGTGWVWAAFVDVSTDLSSIPVLDPAGAPAAFAAAAPEALPVNLPPFLSGVTATARQIFLRGREAGNRPNVFSKIGDSITVAGYFLRPIGVGDYNLRDFSSLFPVVQYFLAERAWDSNSFANNSLGAANGWTTELLFDPSRANPSVCNPGEVPIECEYRVVRPALALIMLGTNDCTFMPADLYRAHLNHIVELSIARGVIPVLSTIPPRPGLEGAVEQFNAIITQVARAHDVPLWDYYTLMRDLPNQGLSPDNIHPSAPPSGSAADFTPENLAYGYTVRNLTALIVLDTLWRQVMY